MNLRGEVLRPAPAPGGGAGAVALCALVGGLLLAWRGAHPEPLAGALIEVRGDVPVPGIHQVDPPTLAAAVEAAGGDARGLPATLLTEGDAVVVGPEGARVAPLGNPRLVLLPVDVNVHDAAALAAVPALGPSLAAAIVEDRGARGPFGSLAALSRVPGIGAATVAEAAPFLTVGDVGPVTAGPLDVNAADAEALEALPGIGPALAARIVADRERRGPFGSLAALSRVPGIGRATVARLEGRAVVGAP